MKIFIISLLGILPLSANDLMVIKDQSNIMATAQATGHDFEAAPLEYQCKVTLNQQNTIEKLSFSFKLADLKTGNEKRDREMLRWLEAERYPELHFELNRVENKSEPLILGSLTFHNTTRKLAIPYQQELIGGLWVLRGKFIIDTSQFGLKQIRKFGFLKVDEALDVTFELVCKQTTQE